MTTRRRTGLVVLGVILGLGVVPAGAAAAFAHDALVKTAPASGQTVTTLTRIDLTFNADPINLNGADIIQVKGPDGKYYETGCPTLDGPVMSTPVHAGPAGTYEVLWRVVSSDGHPVANTYTFTYRPAAAKVAAGSANPRCGAKSAATANAAVAQIPSSPPPTGMWIGIGFGAFAVLVVAAAAILLINKPRNTDGDQP